MSWQSGLLERIQGKDESRVKINSPIFPLFWVAIDLHFEIIYILKSVFRLRCGQMWMGKDPASDTRSLWQP